ncbi:hypothetical protein FT643_02915 [Ketobacter sp. MCCC 1A13808]|uniref:zinc-binding metallopeptidase family protein n=1 Tax=Ketobacter sp. MCCC 1A13808 TaxID=2602738 RepID=UPI000F25733B|nr:putative zinc-binding metallopeptidase [Ketobacter sp. MCCC 1A13808]MVF11086.1 hypothetical protein [Ketobacter sp. MCCC 1A13808]RLP56467.1 MAG: hypothetical protein D6160_03525 [Ketobacter sp.]
MKLFNCQNCGHTVFFENTHCEQCRAALGFIPELINISSLKPAGNGGWIAAADCEKTVRFYCSNHQHQVCNWLVDSEDENTLCIACQMNRYIPNVADAEQKLSWQEMEFAKHRLMYSLLRLQLPLQSKDEAPEEGLSFDFINTEQPLPDDAQSTTGHAEGQVTINLAEADPAEREQMRKDMNESYRTLIGHFRHEVGHYYWDQIIAPYQQRLKAYRRLFGDEREDYGEALKSHYEQGAPADWNTRFVTTYASSHPWEDWAETWAHYFHIIDTLETAYAFGMTLGAPQQTQQTHNMVAMTADIDPYNHADFEEILNRCIPLTFAVNSLNRSMGQPDLYPFVLNEPVKTKLGFIHQLMLSYRPVTTAETNESTSEPVAKPA